MSMINKSTHQSDPMESPNTEEEFLDKLHSDSILSSLHENEYSGKFTQKTTWQKFEDHVWYDAHKYFEELAYNGGRYDSFII